MPEDNILSIWFSEVNTPTHPGEYLQFPPKHVFEDMYE
jgi:hypothetical protein